MLFITFPDREYRKSHRSSYVKYLASLDESDAKFKKFNYAVQNFNNELKDARCMRVSYVSDTGKTAGAIYIGINSDRVRWNVQFPKTASIRTGVFISTTILKKERKKRKPRAMPDTGLRGQIITLLPIIDEIDEKPKTGTTAENGGTVFVW